MDFGINEAIFHVLQANKVRAFGHIIAYIYIHSGLGHGQVNISKSGNCGFMKETGLEFRNFKVTQKFN